MNDLFAYEIRAGWVDEILEHCRQYPGNRYVFQTKNPARAFLWHSKFPKDFIIGTTIETNRSPDKFSKAPPMASREYGIREFVDCKCETFVTIEPILDFDVPELVHIIDRINPKFVNIGADSKNCGLPEPDADKVKALIGNLQGLGIEIKKKINLARIVGGDFT